MIGGVKDFLTETNLAHLVRPVDVDEAVFSSLDLATLAGAVICGNDMEISKVISKFSNCVVNQIIYFINSCAHRNTLKLKSRSSEAFLHLIRMLLVPFLLHFCLQKDQDCSLQSLTAIRTLPTGIQRTFVYGFKI